MGNIIIKTILIKLLQQFCASDDAFSRAALGYTIQIIMEEVLDKDLSTTEPTNIINMVQDYILDTKGLSNNVTN